MSSQNRIPVRIPVPTESPEGDVVRYSLADPPATLAVGTTTFPVYQRCGHKRDKQVIIIAWAIGPYPRTPRQRRLLTEHTWFLIPGRYEPRIGRYDPERRRLVILSEELYHPLSLSTWRPKDGNHLNLLRWNLRPANKKRPRPSPPPRPSAPSPGPGPGTN